MRLARRSRLALAALVAASAAVCRADDGEGFPHDYVEAMRWYSRAAEQKHAPATFSVGCTRWGAAELGHTEQQITTVRFRWLPGPQDLQVEVPLDEWRAKSLTPDELDALRKAGLRGRLGL